MGLKRKAITDCARWAELYRVMGQPFPGPWKWTHHPWLYEMHLADSERIIGQKAAQMGYTEWALNKTFYAMDIQGISVLYILPSNDDASDFSAARFDKALENSKYLSQFFSDVKNVGHKRAGNTSLYVRGSRSRSKLKSIDTALIIFDEMEEMSQANFSLALERQSGQRIETQQVILLSTPSIEDKGINAEYKQSTQEHYFFKCPRCSKLTELVFPDSLIITGEKLTDPNLRNSHYICIECKGKILQEEKEEILKPVAFGGSARYIPTHSNRPWRGFYINQMYSMTVPAYRLAESALKAKSDPTEETEYYNSKGGLPHAVEGAKISEKQLTACFGSHRKGNRTKTGIRTIGIDVGSVCHLSIEEWDVDQKYRIGMNLNDYATPTLIYEGTTSGNIDDFSELDQFMYEWSVDGGIIDAEPERRVALQFAYRHWGKIFLCDFLWSQQGRTVTMTPEEERTIKVNRTSWFDLALTRFKTKQIRLPVDVSQQYKDHIREPQRVYKKDKFGNPFGYYESVKADHFALSRIYSEIALGVAVSVSANQNISSVY
jgi:DNA-directed RNA polymerase subunit RPC12/RpoP